MPKTISYVRRILPFESKRVPTPPHGQSTSNPSPSGKQPPSFQGSGTLPEAPAIPASRISAPR